MQVLHDRVTWQQVSLPLYLVGLQLKPQLRFCCWCGHSPDKPLLPLLLLPPPRLQALDLLLPEQVLQLQPQPAAVPPLVHLPWLLQVAFLACVAQPQQRRW